MGSYHGIRSFHTFSHQKAVLLKFNWLDVWARYPPYDSIKIKTLGVLQYPRTRFMNRVLYCVAYYLAFKQR